MKQYPGIDPETVSALAASGAEVCEAYARLVICHLAARDDLDSVLPKWSGTDADEQIGEYGYAQFRVLAGVWSVSASEDDTNALYCHQARFLRDHIRNRGWGVQWGDRVITLTLDNFTKSVITMFAAVTRTWPRPCDVRMLMSFANPDVLSRTRLGDYVLKDNGDVEQRRLQILFKNAPDDNPIRVRVNGLVEETLRYLEEHFQYEFDAGERAALAMQMVFALELGARESSIQ